MVHRVQASTAAGRSAFDADLDMQDASLRRLQTLCEAAQRLSDAFKLSHPEIAWSRIAGMRNRLVHAYLDIDLDIVWNTIQTEVHELGELVERALVNLRRDDREELP